MNVEYLSPRCARVGLNGTMYVVELPRPHMSELDIFTHLLNVLEIPIMSIYEDKDGNFVCFSPSYGFMPPYAPA